MARYTRKPKPVATLLSMMLLAFTLSVVIILTLFTGYILWHSGQMQARTEATLFDSVRSEVHLGYSAMEYLLQAHSEQFLSVHQQALDILESAPAEDDIDLVSLQAELEAQAGLPLDIYLISPELVVERTTYEPDAGLDFRHPALMDGRIMIERALSEGRIVMGAPILEAVARQFRVYTYSPLGDEGRVLELGFVSPVLNQYFRDMNQKLADRDLFSARLYFLMWDDWLLPLQPDEAHDDAEDKEALLSAYYQDRRESIEFFRQARDTQQPVEVSHESQAPEYYIHVLSIRDDSTWDMDVMAYVRMNVDLVEETRAGLISGAILVLLVLTLITGLQFHISRQSLTLPLTEAANAIEQWHPITLHGRGRGVRELQLLASHYNGMLDAARSRIRGLGEEARTDSLTGLINRAGLEAELDIELRRSSRYGTPFAIILLDIDHFKRINDRHGHLVGDQILKGLAETLKQRSRLSDSTGRWGGEEFLVICRDTRLEEAAALAEDLRADLARSKKASTKKTSTQGCTASFGIAAVRPGDSMESLFTRADNALYRAKQGGRNRVETEEPPTSE